MTGVAPSSWEAFQERLGRLYEQNAPLEDIRRGVELYVRRWKRWVVSGLGDINTLLGWRDRGGTCVTEGRVAGGPDLVPLGR